MAGSTHRGSESAVLLIDGQCIFCNRVTHFVAKRDKKKHFYFASLQSLAGRRLLLDGHLPADHLTSVVLVQDGQYYTKSAAALRVCRGLGGLWPMLYGFILLPSALRDPIYDWVANRRYQWFGKSDVCILPAPDLQKRFLENGVHAAADTNDSEK